MFALIFLNFITNNEQQAINFLEYILKPHLSFYTNVNIQRYLHAKLLHSYHEHYIEFFRTSLAEIRLTKVRNLF